jgi:hypothetical protein
MVTAGAGNRAKSIPFGIIPKGMLAEFEAKD